VPNYAPRHEHVWGCGGIAPSFLTPALDAGEWSVSRLGRLTPEERAPDTNWRGGWVSPIAGMDAVEKMKISRPCRESSPGRPVHSPSLYRLRHNLVDTTRGLGGMYCLHFQGQGKPSKLAQRQPLLAFNRKVPGSNRGLDTVYPDYSFSCFSVRLANCG
jgi:hypothetical protein